MRSLFVLGIVVHLILLYSIFDIYYSSPIIFGLREHSISRNEGPAKRVIVFSADGLRYDTFVKNPDLTPFLHGIFQQKKGVSGLSLSHMPTESRPGHVAIFAGFTEDVSAVAAGWKKNPVPFDSIFNRSQNSWLIGSPDIVELFPSANITVESYSADQEDFGSKEAWKLDEWVFQRFEKLLTSAKIDQGLNERLRAGKNAIFLHLLGIDTNGHGHKPHSKEYLDNLRFVDEEIRKTSELVEEFFGDSRTTFIMTADHGMTDWGSHGAGSESEVNTPFVAWGSGIAKTGVNISLAQVDIAPLLATLLGTAIPTNSIGMIPWEIVNASDEYLYLAAFAHYMQLREQLTHLHDEKARRFVFSEYPEFGDTALNSLNDQLVVLGKSRRFSAGVTMWRQFGPKIRDAIYYYHRYDRTFLGFCVSVSFLLWVALVTSLISRSNQVDLFSREILRPKIAFISLFSACLFYSLYCQFSFSCVIYVLLPIVLSSFLYNVVDVHGGTLKKYTAKHGFYTNFTAILLYLLAVAPFVLVFVDRRWLVTVFVLLNFVPYTYGSIGRYDWKILWHFVCILLCVFPFLATVGQQQHPFLCLFTSALASLIYKMLANTNFFISRRELLVSISKMNLCTTGIIFLTEFVFEKTPTFLLLICWTTLPAAFILPIFLTKRKVVDRLIAFIGYLFIPYSLLSIAYESIFVLLFVALLVILIRFEFANVSDSVLLQLDAARRQSRGLLEPISKHDAIRAWTVMALVIGALFGTGNFASLNSFNPSTLHRFISVFSPFTMASLLILKLLIPLLLLSMAFATILFFDTDHITRLSYLTLTISDLIAMCLFYQLKDTGSWLDIGLSISAYIVSMFLSLSLLLLLLSSTFILTFTSPFTHEFFEKMKRLMSDHIWKLDSAENEQDKDGDDGEMEKKIFASEVDKYIDEPPRSSLIEKRKRQKHQMIARNPKSDIALRYREKVESIIEEYVAQMQISADQKNRLRQLAAERLAEFGGELSLSQVRAFLLKFTPNPAPHSSNRLLLDGIELDPHYARFTQDYTQKDTLGKGAFGDVYKVFSKLDRCHYAVKKIKLTQPRRAGNAKKQSGAARRILMEVLTMARLDHPHIVRYHHAWLEETPDFSTFRPRRSSDDSTGNKVVELSSSPEERNQLMPVLNTEATNSYNPSFAGSSVNPPLKSSRFFLPSASGSSLDESIGTKETQESSKISRKSSSSSESSGNWMSSTGIVSVAENGELMELQQPQHVSAMVREMNDRVDSSQTCPLHIFIQMELCESTLSEFLTERNHGINDTVLPLELRKETFTFALNLMSAVDYLHENAVIHRDIKPSNIFLATTTAGHKKLKLGDFGLACYDTLLEECFSGLQMMRPENLHEHSVGVGTALYAAPEQMTTREYGVAADVYSCALVIIEMFGVFHTDMQRVTNLEKSRRGRIPDYVFAVSPELHKLLVPMLLSMADARPYANEIVRRIAQLESQAPHLETDAECIKRLQEEIIELCSRLDEKEHRIVELEMKLKLKNGRFREAPW
ncbi:unnamed protein product, partial [Mesorhabditis belari]|uniref:GPI ethanolamine phosphate transferase 1 n=1 Tax=Mesorhabditis belari TaxID=2138241 RepID=A0AAF3F0Q2_9BILA